MPLISIIVPAYNPGEHFNDCLRSIATQSFLDYEVIIIDDGSSAPVDSALVAKCGLFENSTRVVRTENHGPYAARRKGIAEASGTYFMSIDADDELIGTSALAKIASALGVTRVDMLLINASSRKDGSTPLVDYSELSPKAQALEAAPFDPAAFKDLFARDYIFNSTWTKVVRRDRINGLPEPFPRILMADDRMLDIDFLPSVRTAAILDEPLYYYRPAATSITHSGYRPDYYLQVCEVESRVLGWLDAVGFDEEAWATNFLRVTCNALLGLAYNEKYSGRDLETFFDEVCAQEVYARADSKHALARLGSYERAQLSLLDKKRYKALRYLMFARGIASRARTTLHADKTDGDC